MTRPAAATLALLLTACSGGTKDSVDTSVSPSDTDTDADTDADTDTDTDTDTDLDCDSRPLEVAPPRGEVQAVWDGPRGRMVFFGGDQGQPDNCITQTDIIGDTWAFYTDCDNFSDLSTGSGPFNRARHAVAHDADGQVMYLHGGRYRAGTSGDYTLYSDLWAFDLTSDTWTDVGASGGPSPRHSHVAWFAGGKLYVHGGNASNDGLYYTPLSDMWSFDPGTGAWTELSPGGDDPGTRIFAAGATSDDGSTLYLYGGTADFFGPTYGDLFAYDVASGSWTQLDADGGSGDPAARFGAHIVHDAAGNRVILWAGHDVTDLGNTNQVWAFDLGGGGWSELSAGDVVDAGANGFCDFPADFTDPDLDSPERRYTGAAVVADGELLIFGGKTDCGIINDVWGWDLGAGGWTERSPATSGEICLRAFAECSSLCF